MEEFDLTGEELENLDLKLDEIMATLESEKEEVEFFYQHPIRFLNRFNLTVMSYIRNSRNLVKFIRAIREMIGSIRNIVNGCLRCKLAVIFIMFATLGKAQIAWSTVITILDSIRRSLRHFFQYTSDEIDKIIASYSSTLDKVRPSYLAFKICENVGYC